MPCSSTGPAATVVVRRPPARRKELEDPSASCSRATTSRLLELDVLDERGTILTTTWHAIQMCAAFLAARRAGEFDKG